MQNMSDVCAVRKAAPVQLYPVLHLLGQGLATPCQNTVLCDKQ